MAENDFASSPSSSFSGFSSLHSSPSSHGSLVISSPSSVHSSDLSDITDDDDSEFSENESLPENNPDSDISDEGEGQDILPESEDDYSSADDDDEEDSDSQYYELSSQATRASDAEFWDDQLVDIDISEFTERCGPNHMLPLAATALDYFLLFFPHQLFVLMTEQTNLYARQSHADPRHWQEVN